MSRDDSDDERAAPLTAFVNFPSPYTQTLLLRALAATLPAVNITVLPPDEKNPPRLQWADYDLMTFDKPHADPSYQISSYIYRKALIRKHQLHATVQEYLAKADHRGEKSVLAAPENGGVGGMPKGWTIDIQFADELDELLLDDLYELAQAMQLNEGDGDEKRWFILKPGFADRAQGIRLFSTEDELRDIFEEFEPESEDEFEDAEDGEDDGSGLASGTKAVTLNDDDEDKDEGTAVQTSHLRHFVIQEYLPRPVLFDLLEHPGAPPRGQKFHLRAYVLVTGSYTVHLSRTMLALFSGALYAPPTSSADGEPMDLRPHLTNTCLQTDGFGAPVPQEDLVRLFWDLEGLTALSSSDGGYSPKGTVSREWLDATFAKVGEVVAEAVKAGVECGSFGLQLMPNAFEIFGVDLILSHPPSTDGSSTPTTPTPITAPSTPAVPAPGDAFDTSLPALAVPDVTLLEFNASPDFHQSGEVLRPRLLEMFKGVVRLSIAPFFGIDAEQGKDKVKEGPMELGEERWDWRLVGQGEVRGNWA
ncbi:putative tubulin--tyrosine ligase pby1 [Vanrija albida]|uniref:Tubulin--tyrosine ligase pby1 n=1 Tax=Vanrija albida TaxID=181172 RepID=A0ABR3Q1M8_9TREE